MSAARFFEALAPFEIGMEPISIETLQVNITRLCNQSCVHCHVDASPHRTESMSTETIRACLTVLEGHPEIRTLDITGGAPELHPDFRILVEGAVALSRRVIVRHNLTVSLDPHPRTGESMRYLPEYFARNGVSLCCSLPHHASYLTERQRGSGVFAKSIESLRLLNEEGYGLEDSPLRLDLVTNPAGPYLPSAQASLERDFREQLLTCHGVRFHRLLSLTNMPVKRFAARLDALGATEEYLQRLADACNPAAAANVMCRSMVSVGWDGTLYDCDFNQMAGVAIDESIPATVAEFDAAELLGRDIRFADHCLGCTAGAGSSCGGATC